MGIAPRLLATAQGFSVDESPQASFFYNGLQFTLFDSQLLIPGAHRLPGQTAVGPAELNFYFQGGTGNKDVRCICVPIQVGSGVGEEYFSELGKAIPARKQSIESLFTPTSQFFTYVGAAYGNRSKTTNISSCENAKRITYYVLSLPVFIRQADITRIRSNLATHVGPAEPPNKAASSTRIQALVRLLPVLRLGSSDSPAGTKATGSTKAIGDSVPTSQIKCRPLDAKNDIQNGVIYIGGKARPTDSTLEKELARAADTTSVWQDSAVSIQPGDVEDGLAAGISFGLAIVMIAILSFLVLVFIYKGYKPTLSNLYNVRKNPFVGISLTISDFFSSTINKIC